MNQTKASVRLLMSAALILSAKAAKEDVDKNLRVCNYESDLQVEFSECDPYGTTRNGKNTKLKLTRVFCLFSVLLLRFVLANVRAGGKSHALLSSR